MRSWYANSKVCISNHKGWTDVKRTSRSSGFFFILPMQRSVVSRRHGRYRYRKGLMHVPYDVEAVREPLYFRMFVGEGIVRGSHCIIPICTSQSTLSYSYYHTPLDKTIYMLCRLPLLRLTQVGRVFYISIQNAHTTLLSFPSSTDSSSNSCMHSCSRCPTHRTMIRVRFALVPKDVGLFDTVNV